jgi:hypothetical protein
MTATSGNVYTAAQFNTNTRDNLNASPNALATTAGSIFVTTAANAIAERIPAAAHVDTSETTASSTATDLTTPGPAVTVTSGTQMLVIVNCRISSSSASYAAVAAFAISGATTLAAAIQNSGNSAGTSAATAGGAWLLAVTAGSNTVTMKYWTVSGGSTGTFSNRYLTVIPL